MCTFKNHTDIKKLFVLYLIDQVRNAERVQLDQIPLPDAPVDPASEYFFSGFSFLYIF